MIEFYAKEFVLTWEKLDDAITFSHAHREEKANPEQQQHLVELVVKLYNECSRSTLINSRNLCDHSYKWLADPSYYPSEHGFPKQIPARPFTSVYTELAAIRKRMIEELDVVRFAKQGSPINENVILGIADDRAWHSFSRAVQEDWVRT